MQARNLVRRMLGQARQIDLLDADRGKYFRIVARVVANGKDVGASLIDRGLAVAYDGGTKMKDWCTGFSCSPRKTCGEMTSCEEATFHLQSCGNTRLDRDKEGIPCAST